MDQMNETYILHIITTDPPTKNNNNFVNKFIFNKISFDLPFFVEQQTILCLSSSCIYAVYCH